jgi:iron complex outermembrane receptor protein
MANFLKIIQQVFLAIFISGHSAFLLQIATLLLPNIALAADDAFSEQEILQEFPVVLSASRLSQPLSEAPNAMTVIDRNMINASGFRTIADLFRLVPGMYVGNLDGHTPIVAYHGSTDQYSRRMQVLVDGRSVYLPPFSSVDWEDIPLHIDDIERIEVVRGPAAASHGANSLHGVINIITRDAASLDGARISATKGEGGVSDIAAHMGKNGTNLDYRVTLGYRADNGYDSAIMNDSSATRLANLRANYHPNTVDSFDFQLGYSEGVRGLGVAGREDENLFRDTWTSSDFQQLTWLHALPQGDEVRVQYYHIHRGVTDNAPRGLAPQYNTPDDTKVERHDLELQHTTELGASNRLVWGAGARSDNVENPLNLTIPQSLYQSRLFVHDEWRMTSSTLLNAGAMYENDGMGHNNTSPRVALNYHFTPQQTLRVSSSVAYRSPATVEEKSNSPGELLSVGGLRPERVFSKEIGYLGEFSQLGLSVNSRVYADQVSDMIFIDPLLTPPSSLKPYSFANLLSANFRGFENTVEYHWGDKSSLIFNYARQMMDCEITGTLTFPFLQPLLQDIADQCTPSVPWNSGSLLLAQQVTHDLMFSAGYYYQGELQFVGTSAAQSRMQRLDLRIAQAFGRKEKSGGGEVSFVVQNVLQDNYTNYSAVPQTNNILFNRRAYLTATINF